MVSRRKPKRESHYEQARATASQRTAAAIIAGRLRCDPQTARRVADRLPPTPLDTTPAFQALGMSLGELQQLAEPESR